MSATDHTTVQAGCLPRGTETHLGTIEAVSLTAYLIDGAWVPYSRIHGKPQPVAPLVMFA